MNLIYETAFTVMPTHCNYHFPMIFGGAFFSEIELCAAVTARRLLHDSECDFAVTYKVLDLTFHDEAHLGDLIFLRGEVVELKRKAIVIHVSADREVSTNQKRDHMADATLVFVSKKDKKFHPHGLEMPKQ